MFTFCQALEEQRLADAAEESALGFKPSAEDWNRANARPKLLPEGLGPPPEKPTTEEVTFVSNLSCQIYFSD